jgi:thymidylate synthase
MFYEDETLDDLLRKIFTQLLEPHPKIKASKEHCFTELFGPVLRLSNPRARLSRTETKGKVYSAIGELLWYLSGENKASFMDYYVPYNFYSKEAEKGTDYVRSGYGERLNNFGGVNQIQNVIDLLKKKPTSRRAVLQLFYATDLTGAFTSFNCTSTMQFLIRDQKLNMIVNMRSNDAFLGLPHDVFAFTMIQEIIARSVDVELELGDYQHNVGSLHLYQNKEQMAIAYMLEGWQEKTAMPKMPKTDPWPAIERVRDIEQSLREGSAEFPDIADLDLYWQDICRLLYVYRISKDTTPESLKGIERARNAMASKSYWPFLDAKIDALQKTLEK